jgi:hypothetical protein
MRLTKCRLEQLHKIWDNEKGSTPLELLDEIDTLRAQVVIIHENQRNTEDENTKLKAALEKIADPRKRDHSEPDKYTELGCVMNIAQEALDAVDASGSEQSRKE